MTVHTHSWNREHPPPFSSLGASGSFKLESEDGSNNLQPLMMIGRFVYFSCVEH